MSRTTHLAALALLFAAARAQAAAPDASADANAQATTGAPAGSAPNGASAGAEAATTDALPEITKMPVLTHFVEAAYPERAKQEGLEAVVLLDIDIDDKGRVEAVSVATPSAAPDYGFEAAASAAAAQFEFSPAEAGGAPIPVRITYKYSFVLTPAAAPNAPAAAQAPGAPPPAPPEPPKVINFAGTLRERGSRTPLPGVKVTVFRGDGEAAEAFEAMTDGDGAFAFYSLTPGDWRIHIDPAGYYPTRTTETVQAGERLDVTYYIERISLNPFDVLVEATRPKKEVTRRTIESAEIERVPGTFGDPVAVVANMPSVARPPSGLNMLVVRGASPEDTRTFVGGLEVPTIYHFWGIRSVLPTGMLQYIDFYPGNFSAYYGRATGGILDVQLKEIEPMGLNGYLDVNIMDSGLFASTPLGDNASAAIAVRRSYIDVVLNAVMPEDSLVSFSTAPRFYDYQALATWRPAPGHKLSFFFFGSDDAMKVVFENPGDAGLQLKTGSFSAGTSFYRGMLRYDYAAPSGFKNEVRLALGNDAQSQRLGDQMWIEFSILQLQLRDTAEWQLADNVSLRGGIDYITMWSSWDVYTEGLRPMKEGDSIFGEEPGAPLSVKVDGRAFQYPAAFVELSWRPLPSLLLVPALRADYFGNAEAWTLDPRFSARFAINDTLTAKAAVGIFHQEPTADEMDSTFGNPDLKPEWAIHYSAGAEVKPFEHLAIDVTGFYKDMRDMVARSAAVVSRDGALVPETFNNQGHGRVYGLDLLVRHDFSNNFFGWISYTLSRSERRDPGKNDWRLFDYDQTHILTVLGTYQLPHHWEIGARWRLVSGNPTTPIDSGVFSSDYDTYQPVSGATNSDRMPPFHQLDVRVDKKWIWDGWMLNAYIDIQNIYGRANPEGYMYNSDFSEKKTTGGMPILTIFGLRAEI